ncbi:MAG: 6-phosphogluconolactonase, partial [Bacteroidota bacterium]
IPIAEGYPAIDLLILGMGSDGHTASIFPHQMELLERTNWCAVAVHPDSGQKRVTLTGPVLNQAVQKHFLVTGSSKCEVLNQIIHAKDGYTDYPASHIHDATWWLDNDAAADIDITKV